jgi:hypothetical protein
MLVTEFAARRLRLPSLDTRSSLKLLLSSSPSSTPPHHIVVHTACHTALRMKMLSLFMVVCCAPMLLLLFLSASVRGESAAPCIYQVCPNDASVSTDPASSFSPSPSPNLLSTSTSIGYCLPIRNNIKPSVVKHVKFDTFYSNGLGEKASMDPTPNCTSTSICDNIGYSIGSFYTVEAILYANNGTGQPMIHTGHEPQLFAPSHLVILACVPLLSTRCYHLRRLRLDVFQYFPTTSHGQLQSVHLQVHTLLLGQRLRLFHGDGCMLKSPNRETVYLKGEGGAVSNG